MPIDPNTYYAYANRAMAQKAQQKAGVEALRKKSPAPGQLPVPERDYRFQGAGPPNGALSEIQRSGGGWLAHLAAARAGRPAAPAPTQASPVPTQGGTWQGPTLDPMDQILLMRAAQGVANPNLSAQESADQAWLRRLLLQKFRGMGGGF